MPQPAISPGIDQSLDIHRKRFPQVALDLELRVDDLPNLDYLIFTQILDPNRPVDSNLVKNVPGRSAANPEYIGQTDIGPFISGQIHSGYTSHMSPLSLPLLVSRIFTENTHDATAPHDFTLGTNRLDG
jgi:hypothetical protein